MLTSWGKDRILPSGMASWRTARCASSASSRTGGSCARPQPIWRQGELRNTPMISSITCLVMRYGLTTDRDWPFRIDGKERRVLVQGHRIANDGELVRVWCLNGFGIARKSRLDV